MYTYTYGYDQEEVSVPKGQVIAGNAIGIIVPGLDWHPFIPGNVENATTFDFPVCHKTIEVDSTQLVTPEPDPTVLEHTIKAGKELQKQGCRAITGSCGYFANYLPEVAAALNVPCFLSSLMQVPMISRALKPSQKVAIICYNGPVLESAPALENCGIDRSKIIIVGAESLFTRLLRKPGRFSPKKLEQGLVELAKQMVSENLDIGAILLECSDMPPYACAIQEAVRLPVFDFTTLINWVYNAVVRHPFTGYM